MSDDEDDLDMAPADVHRGADQPVLKYGSLEEQARAADLRATAGSTSASTSSSDGLVISQATLTASMHSGRAVAATSAAASSSSSLADAGRAAGNINIAGSSAEYYELSESAKIEREKHSALLKDMELRKRARSIAIPTNDTLVRRRLRELGHPITLFGERQPGRRERLGVVLAKLALEDRGVQVHEEEKEEEKVKKEDQKAFLTPGPDALRAARAAIVTYTLEAAKRRLEREREEAAQQRSFVPHPSLSQYAAIASTLGDVRPLSSCAFSPSSALLATSSWSGLCKVWTVAGCAERLVMRGHTFNATDVAWHPHAEGSQSASSVNLASCGMDGQVLLWPLQPTASDDVDMAAATSSIIFSSSASSSSPLVPDTPSCSPLATLHPHTDRCSRLAFHPSGLQLYSTSWDQTWQLHDLTTQQSVLSQPGHVYPVYSVSLHPDGSLLLTGDTGGIGHVWDARSGLLALSLVGHARAVLCSDWSPEGWLVATGSADNSVRLWDIRSKRCLYTLPAHSKLVSGVQWMRGVWSDERSTRVSSCLVTCGYDGLVKLWDAHSVRLLRELRGHDKMVMRVAVARSTDSWHSTLPTIASAAYDRTWKLWNVPD